MTSGIKRLNIAVLLSHDVIKLGTNIQPIKRIVRKYFMKNGISIDVYIPFVIFDTLDLLLQKYLPLEDRYILPNSIM
jgi:hypothetical protein